MATIIEPEKPMPKPDGTYGESALRYTPGIKATDIESFKYAAAAALVSNYRKALAELDAMSDLAKRTVPWQTNHRIYESRLRD